MGEYNRWEAARFELEYRMTQRVLIDSNFSQQTGVQSLDNFEMEE